MAPRHWLREGEMGQLHASSAQPLYPPEAHRAGHAGSGGHGSARPQSSEQEAGSLCESRIKMRVQPTHLGRWAGMLHCCRYSRQSRTPMIACSFSHWAGLAGGQRSDPLLAGGDESRDQPLHAEPGRTSPNSFHCQRGCLCCLHSSNKLFSEHSRVWKNQAGRALRVMGDL